MPQDLNLTSGKTSFTTAVSLRARHPQFPFSFFQLVASVLPVSKGTVPLFHLEFFTFLSRLSQTQTKRTRLHYFFFHLSLLLLQPFNESIHLRLNHFVFLSSKFFFHPPPLIPLRDSLLNKANKTSSTSSQRSKSYLETKSPNSGSRPNIKSRQSRRVQTPFSTNFTGRQVRLLAQILTPSGTTVPECKCLQKSR